MVVSALLKQGTDFLKCHEKRRSLVEASGDALDCELLLAYVLGVDASYLLAHNREEVSEDLAWLFEGYLSRLSLGEPVAYILQEKEFFGLKFFVDKRVLIPRPETEWLVERVIETLRTDGGGTLGSGRRTGARLRILDIGTGSGNIAVAIARYFEDAGLDLIDEIVAIDVDSAALEVARMNAYQHGVDHKIKFFKSDLLEVLEEGECYDVIVANLPYIGEVENRFIDSAVEAYEPGNALFAGYDGLDLYKKMFQQIQDKKIGFDVMMGEFGFGQAVGIEKLLNKYFEQQEGRGSAGWYIEKDLAGIDRFFVISKAI